MKTTTLQKTVSLLTLLLCASAYAMEPAKDPADATQAATKPAPLPTEAPFDLTDPVHIALGEKRFNAYCAAYCHGHEGSGGKTPAFRGRTDMTPTMLFKVITEGRVGSDVMPSWHGFTEEKRWELVAYILDLGRKPADK